jgi:hypothetical protein
MQVFKADLENWPEIERLYEKFCLGPFTSRFDLNKEGLRRYFKLSLVDPRYAVLCVREDQDLVGLSIVYEIYAPDIFAGPVPQSFVHVCYIDPKAPRAAGDLMNAAVEEWGRMMKHNYVTANVRVSSKNPFKLRAIDKRYGFKPLYITIGKPLEGGKNDG